MTVFSDDEGLWSVRRKDPNSGVSTLLCVASPVNMCITHISASNADGDKPATPLRLRPTDTLLTHFLPES